MIANVECRALLSRADLTHMRIQPASRLTPSALQSHNRGAAGINRELTRSGDITPGITRRPKPLLVMKSSVSAVGCMPLFGASPQITERCFFKASIRRPSPRADRTTDTPPRPCSPRSPRLHSAGTFCPRMAAPDRRCTCASAVFAPHSCSTGPGRPGNVACRVGV